MAAPSSGGEGTSFASAATGSVEMSIASLSSRVSEGNFVIINIIILFYFTFRYTDSFVILNVPSKKEIIMTHSTLQATQTEICAICFNEEDEDNSGDFIDWMLCANCSLWVHTACVQHPNNAEYILLPILLIKQQYIIKLDS